MGILNYKIKTNWKNIKKRKKCILCKSWNTRKNWFIKKWKEKTKYQIRECKECKYRFTDYDYKKFHIGNYKRYKRVKLLSIDK